MKLKKHYKDYLKQNPNTKISAKDWKNWFGKRIKFNIMKLEEKIKKENYLKSKGWTTFSGEDNWIDTNKEYRNPKWVGMDLETAYLYVKENEHLYENVFVLIGKVLVPNRWDDKGNLIEGEVIQKIKSTTMDGVFYEQFMVKTPKGTGNFYTHEVKGLETNEKFIYN
jgi:hypothetical protein